MNEVFFTWVGDKIGISCQLIFKTNKMKNVRRKKIYRINQSPRLSVCLSVPCSKVLLSHIYVECKYYYLLVTDQKK